MHNDLFSIGPFHVYGYGLMIAIGIFCAYVLAEYRARRIDGLDDEVVFGLTWWAVVCGLNYKKSVYAVSGSNRGLCDIWSFDRRSRRRCALLQIKKVKLHELF